MKKNILAISILLNCSFIMAQTEFDALKMVQPDIVGSARYLGMAGAFGALGGDASAIKDNPAGLGIFRTSEISATLNVMSQNSDAKWNGSLTNDNLMKTGFNNFGFIKVNSTSQDQNNSSGLINSNWAFTANKIKSFDRNSTISGTNQLSSITDYMGYFTQGIASTDLSSANKPYDNINVPWLSVIGYQGFLINPTGISSWESLLNANENVKPTYNIRESGAINEYAISWAGNFGNSLFIGTSANLKSIDYYKTSQYSESFGGGGGMSLTNTVSTTGAGFSFDAGVIYRPIDILRLGISAHSPTFLTLTDENSANLDYYISSTNNGNFDTPTAYNSSYMLATPWKVDASAALIFGKNGLLSAEYSKSYSTNSYFTTTNGDTSGYTDENNGMKSMLQDVQTIKFGAEYKVSNSLAVRVGFANMSAGSNPYADKLLRPNTTRTDVEYFVDNNTNFYTAGIGYRLTNWYIDFAYVNKATDETFYPYNSNNLTYKVNPANVKTNTGNFVLTVGLKL